MADQIRWGILGTGRIAGKFAEGLAALPDAQLLAVGSRSAENAEQFGSRYRIPRRYSSYEALAADPDVQIIYVATPHVFHRDNSILCLRHGKAVLCEKPFAINAAEAEAMIAEAAKRRLFLMEAMWTHFFPAMAKLRELVKDGSIGDVRLVRADFCFRAAFDPRSRLFDPGLGGGALLDVGVYTVAFARMVLDRDPIKIVSAAHIGESGVDEESAFILQYSGGAIASLCCGVRVSTPHEAFVYGTDGWIRVPHLFWQPDRIILCRDGMEKEFPFPRLGNGYSFEAMEAGNCMRAGKLESDIMPWSKTLSIMRSMDMIRAQWNLVYPTER